MKFLLYMYVRMYVCIYVCVCMYVCTYVRTYARMYVCMCVCMYCVCVYVYVCVFVCIYVCVYIYACGFGGLGVACWPLVPKFAGSNPAKVVGFLERKNPQHAFLRRGSKAVGPMSLICGM